MSKAPATLYGVKHPSTTSSDGSVKAVNWAELRAPNAWGRMNDHNGALIIWFHDPTVRDEFRAMFGGIQVTMQRKDEVLTGDKAKALLRRAAS